MPFKNFANKVYDRLYEMSKTTVLFVTDTEKDKLWNTYLGSFPEGTNPIFRERSEHDCNCCKNFIRNYGNIVSIIDGKIVSIWDVKDDDNEDTFYQIVADAMSKYVKSKPVISILYAENARIGTASNLELLADGSTMQWNHFHGNIRKENIGLYNNIDQVRKIRENREMFQRALNEISLESVNIVLELITQNSIYRGEEKKLNVLKFREFKEKYDKIKTAKLKSYFCWLNVGEAHESVARIRNDVIGTLLVDISEGMDLEKAVESYEKKTAPTNYQRTTALVTKAMIGNAEKKVQEIGISSALQRRFAVRDDLTINNVLFADRSTKTSMNVFDDMKKSATVNPKTWSKVEEIPVEKFVKEIIPQSSQIEVLLENRHEKNLMSIIAPYDPDAKQILKWKNNFSWVYNGDVTDSIKERVKRAGGNIDAFLRFSLSWYNFDDLDLHAVEPNDTHIHYGNKGRVHPSSGIIDVDMNAGGGSTRTPVENIVWTDPNKMSQGKYRVFVNNFHRRETVDVGFVVEMEYKGEIKTFNYKKTVGDQESIEVVKFDFSKRDGISIISSLKEEEVQKEIWGIKTGVFHNVSMIMNSPNHWDDNCVGNRHLFFIISECMNRSTTRGIFNEYLRSELNEHRKVFEVLGSKLTVPDSDDQLSGIGFSSTNRDHVIVKVTGNVSRHIKVMF